MKYFQQTKLSFEGKKAETPCLIQAIRFAKKDGNADNTMTFAFRTAYHLFYVGDPREYLPTQHASCIE